MLRASSAGLTSAFPSATRVHRPWKALQLRRAAFPASQRHTQAPRVPPNHHPYSGFQPPLRAPSWSDNVPEGKDEFTQEPPPHTPGSSLFSKLRVGITRRTTRLQGLTTRAAKDGRGERRYRVQSRKPRPALGAGPLGVCAKSGVGRKRRRLARSRPVASREPCPLPSDGPMDRKVARLVRSLHHFRGNHHEAWSAFTELTRLQVEDRHVPAVFPHIPYNLLKEFAFHLCSRRPITTQHFPQLLLVTQRLWDHNKHIPLQLWTSLLLFAGKGLRTGSKKEYDQAVTIFYDMVAGERPGTHLERKRGVHLRRIRGPSVQPDIYIFNTLLNIAARSLSPGSVHHAVSLFKSSGLQPDYITHMSLLVYHTRKRHLSGVRATLRKMTEQNLAMRIDAFNAVIYAYVYNDRNDIAFDISRLVFNALSPDEDQEALEEIRQRLKRTENLTVPAGLKPDVVTFTTLIQAAAYTGDFLPAFSTLHRFISTFSRGRIPPSAAPAFRAIFLGFSKHAVGTSPIETLLSDSKWNLQNLKVVYRLFLQLPTTAVPSRSTIYWIMVAFDKASNQDKSLMQDIWRELKWRYEKHNPTLFDQPRLMRLQRSLFSSPEAT